MNLVYLKGDAAHVLPPGRDYEYSEGTLSYESLLNMDEESRAEIDVWALPAPVTEPNAGQELISKDLVIEDGVPQWRVVFADLPLEDARRAATPAEVWNYQAQIVMKLTPLGSLGLDGAAVGLTEEATVWDAVTAAVAALEPQPRLVAETQLASAPGFRRDSLLIAQLGPVLGLTDEMIDNMFIAAKALP